MIQGEQVNVFNMMAQAQAIKMEMLGMKHSSGRSVTAHVKRTYGLKGNKQKVYEDFRALIKEKQAQLNQE